MEHLAVLYLHLEKTCSPPSPPTCTPNTSLVSCSYLFHFPSQQTSPRVLTIAGSPPSHTVFILQLALIPTAFVNSLHDAKSHRGFFLHFEILTFLGFHDTSFSCYCCCCFQLQWLLVSPFFDISSSFTRVLMLRECKS